MVDVKILTGSYTTPTPTIFNGQKYLRKTIKTKILELKHPLHK